MFKFYQYKFFILSFVSETPSMSVDTMRLQNLDTNKKRSTSSNSDDLVSMARSTASSGVGNKDSLHSYHLWLKEKQKEEEEKKNNIPPKSGTPTSSVKEEDDDNEDDTQEDSFQVDAIMERGPSPPENTNESSNSYEWSYEEQFKQVRASSYS